MSKKYTLTITRNPHGSWLLQDKWWWSIDHLASGTAATRWGAKWQASRYIKGINTPKETYSYGDDA